MTVGTLYDQVDVTGIVDLGGATLAGSVINPFNPELNTGTTFVLLDHDGTDAITATFAGLAEGATVKIGGSSFSISYTGGSGNDVVLTAINDAPEAGDDTFTTSDDVSPFAGALLGNDADVDSSFTVSAVNGSAVGVGTTVTLASGALLTVNADGTFVFDPNGMHQHLPAGTTASETFTYTVSDGTLSDTATVTLTITGIDNGDLYPGTN